MESVSLITLGNDTDQLNTWTNSTNKSSPYFSCFTYLLAMCYIRRNRKGALPIYKLHKRVGDWLEMLPLDIIALNF